MSDHAILLAMAVTLVVLTSGFLVWFGVTPAHAMTAASTYWGACYGWVLWCLVGDVQDAAGKYEGE